MEALGEKPSSEVSLSSPALKMLLFTDTSHKSWGANLRDEFVSGMWTLDLQKLYINKVEMTAV